MTAEKYEPLEEKEVPLVVPYALPNSLFSWSVFIYCVLPLWTVMLSLAYMLFLPGVVFWNLVLLPITIPLFWAIFCIGIPTPSGWIWICGCVQACGESFQIWALQNPRSFLSSLMIPFISVVEGVAACRCDYLPRLRGKYGDNFCCAGMVVLGKWEAVAQSVTSGQARVANLGSQPLILPTLSTGRNCFLLALDDLKPDSDHHAFRACLVKYLFNDASKARENDATAEALFGALVSDYRELPGAEFFTHQKKGWTPFWIKFCHYVLLDLDPRNEEHLAVLEKLYISDAPVLHFLQPMGQLPCLNFSQDMARVRSIYQAAPALKAFEECPAHHYLTKDQLVELIISIIRIAAITGTDQLATTAMGERTLPAYPGSQQITGEQIKQKWDEMPLEDPEAVKRFIQECMRLDPPVSSTHRVATEPFTAVISGTPREFPAGTKILIPSGMAGVDTAHWGATAYQFDYERPHLLDHSMGFNGVGDTSAGRICPGRFLVINTLVKALQRIGSVRRGLDTPAGVAKRSSGSPCC